jgi:hypothetical protein
MASMPANSNTLAGFPSYDTLTNSIHDSDDFMSRNSWVLNAGIIPSFVIESL